MTTPERQTLSEVQKMLKAARPEQIERLLRDVLSAHEKDDTNQRGSA